MRFLKQILSYLRKAVWWMDEHHGFMTFLATAVIGALTVSYAVYSKKQWETMQQQLDLSQGPSVEPNLQSISPLVLESDRWIANVKGILKNHGASVALNIGEYAEMFPYDKRSQFGPASKRQREWCDANRHPKETFATG